jgi:hypothetical protein
MPGWGGLVRRCQGPTRPSAARKEPRRVPPAGSSMGLAWWPVVVRSSSECHRARGSGAGLSRCVQRAWPSAIQTAPNQRPPRTPPVSPREMARSTHPRKPLMRRGSTPAWAGPAAKRRSAVERGTRAAARATLHRTSGWNASVPNTRPRASTDWASAAAMMRVHRQGRWQPVGLGLALVGVEADQADEEEDQGRRRGRSLWGRPMG